MKNFCYDIMCVDSKCVKYFDDMMKKYEKSHVKLIKATPEVSNNVALPPFVKEGLLDESDQQMLNTLIEEIKERSVLMEGLYPESESVFFFSRSN